MTSHATDTSLLSELFPRAPCRGDAAEAGVETLLELKVRRQTEEQMKRLAIVLAGMCLLVATTMPVMRAVAQPGLVTNDNLNQMIKNAKTPSDHEMIAEYYDREAAQNEKAAELHRISLNMYFKTANRIHCNDLIKAYQQAADQDKALAAGHRQMAKNAEASH